MKKIIIALLVVLSVFALVSCSSSEPTVTTQTLTLNTKSDGTTVTTDSWKTQYAYNKTGYGVWYKNADGKYVAVATRTGDNPTLTYGTDLTDADGKTVGKMGATLKDLYQETHTVVDGKDNWSKTYLSTEFTLGVTGDKANGGVWTGEVAVAAKAVSDTQLSGVVGRYNVTFTNTVTIAPTTTVVLDDVVLAVGGTNKPAAASELRDGLTSTGSSVFEIVDGKYVYVCSTTASTPGNEIRILDDDDLLVGKVAVSGSASSVNFNLTDDRDRSAGSDDSNNSYRRFVKYGYTGKFVIGTSKSVDGETLLDTTAKMTFVNINALFDPSVEAVGVNAKGEAKDTVLAKAYVADVDEKVGLFVKTGTKYESLNGYYLAGSDKEYGIGVVSVEQAADVTTLERKLNVKLTTEDAPGILNPLKTLGDKTSEVVSAVLCTYTGDEADEFVIVKEIATLALTFKNELPGHITLETGTPAVYTFRTDEYDTEYEFYMWNDWELNAGSYGFWELITGADANIKIGNVTANLSYAISEGNKDVTFSLSEGSNARAAEGPIYVKYAKTDEDNARVKFVFDCTILANTPL